MTAHRLTQIEDYEPLIGAEAVERIRRKAAPFRGCKVANFNSTYYGGGVAEMLSSLTLHALGDREKIGMWKGTPVIGGNVGGIRYQIEDGVNGFLVSSVEQAAERIVELVKDPKLRAQLGRKAKETVREKFLLTRYLDQYLDLFASFETVFRLRSSDGSKRQSTPSGDAFRAERE